MGQILAIPIALQCQCGVNYCCDNVDEVTGLINPLMSAYHPNSHPITVKLTELFADKSIHSQSSRKLVNSRASRLEYIITLSVISDRLHYLYAANIRQG